MHAEERTVNRASGQIETPAGSGAPQSPTQAKRPVTRDATSPLRQSIGSLELPAAPQGSGGDANRAGTAAVGSRLSRKHPTKEPVGATGIIPPESPDVVARQRVSAAEAGKVSPDKFYEGRQDGLESEY